MTITTTLLTRNWIIFGVLGFLALFVSPSFGTAVILALVINLATTMIFFIRGGKDGEENQKVEKVITSEEQLVLDEKKKELEETVVAATKLVGESAEKAATVGSKILKFSFKAIKMFLKVVLALFLIFVVLGVISQFVVDDEQTTAPTQTVEAPVLEKAQSFSNNTVESKAYDGRRHLSPEEMAAVLAKQEKRMAALDLELGYSNNTSDTSPSGLKFSDVYTVTPVESKVESDK